MAGKAADIRAWGDWMFHTVRFYVPTKGTHWEFRIRRRPSNQPSTWEAEFIRPARKPIHFETSFKIDGVKIIEMGLYLGKPKLIVDGIEFPFRKVHVGGEPGAGPAYNFCL